jgi:MFS family permease
VVGLLADGFGWRVALQTIGLAGIPLALIMVMALREPARPAASKVQVERALPAIGGLMRRPALIHLVLAYALGSICTSGMTQWLPTFLVRSFGMSLTGVGAWSGLATAFGSIGGLLCGGALATWLFAHDRRWELWLPALTYAISFPLLAAICFSAAAWQALALKTVGYFFSAIGGGVALAAVQSFAEPNRRATAVSLMLLCSSLLGLGMGPYLIGLLSDLFEPAYGKESLRYALLCACALVAWSVMHFLLAARHSEHDRVG